MLTVAALALLVTLAVEIPIVALCYPGQRARMALVCAATTTATNLLMNLVLFRIATYTQYILIGEVGAVVIEACVYVLAARERDLPRAIVAAGAANMLSYAAGFLVTG